MHGARFWLISLVSFVTILASTIFFPALAKIPSNIFLSPPQEFIEIETSKPSAITFKPNRKQQGHQFITEFTLSGSWQTPDKSPINDRDGKPLGFTPEAIEEIYQANRSVDLRPGSDLKTSEDFGIPQNHFDNELFELGSARLQTLKKGVVNALRAVNQTEDRNCSLNGDNPASAKAGRAARKLLGQALHSLQDFYAHTNWVELGFRDTEIDTRLGRSRVPNPPPGFSPAQPDDPGTLNPALVGSRKINLLTSGYFESITSPCRAPNGKMRHGAAIVCSKGLNKDENDRPGYAEAQALAIAATRDFVNQIIVEEPEIRGNIPRIKALMGLLTRCRSVIVPLTPNSTFFGNPGDFVPGRQCASSTSYQDVANCIYISYYEKYFATDPTLATLRPTYCYPNVPTLGGSWDWLCSTAPLNFSTLATGRCQPNSRCIKLPIGKYVNTYPGSQCNTGYINGAGICTNPR